MCRRSSVRIISHFHGGPWMICREEFVSKQSHKLFRFLKCPKKFQRSFLQTSKRDVNLLERNKGTLNILIRQDWTKDPRKIWINNYQKINTLIIKQINKLSKHNCDFVGIRLFQSFLPFLHEHLRIWLPKMWLHHAAVDNHLPGPLVVPPTLHPQSS